MKEIGAGKAGPGRPKGLKNQVTVTLKDAILHAAEDCGFDGEGLEGLTGYCKRLAISEPRAFASLLGRVLPTSISAENSEGKAINIIISSVEANL